MSVYRDKTANCYVFEFDRYIDGQRVRTRKRLPKTWNQAQADAFDRQESARLYAIASGIKRQDYTIEDAVKKYIGYHFRQARAKVGMDDLHIHDLRHSAASELINNGVDLYTVGAVLGHKSNASTKRYSHLATDSLRVAVMKIGKKAA